MHTMLKLAATLAAAGFLSNAQAVVVSPGTGPVAGPTVGSPYPSVSDFGTLLGFVSTDVKTTTFAGEARAAVFDGREAGVNLDFYYQFTNFGDSADAITRITAGGFSGMSVDVRQDGGMWGDFVRGMSATSTVDLSSDGTLGFNFEPTVLPGRTTTVLRVRTAATSFVDSWMSIIDGTSTVAHAFAPSGAVLPPPIVDVPGDGLPPPVAEVPEPETYAMMLAGLGMLGFVGRRRRHAAMA
jgi:hypothetical protein